MAKKKKTQTQVQPQSQNPEASLPFWARADLFFGDRINPIGVVQLPTAPADSSAISTAPAQPIRKNGRGRPKEHVSGADYTVAQAAAKMGNLSTDKVREMFRDEPGVKKLMDRDYAKKRKRPYATLLIPEEVFERVNRRMTNPGKAS